MKRADAEQSAALDDLLCRWANWLRPVNVGRGYNSRAVACGEFRISRQYDDANGALDEAIEHQQMRAVDAEIERIPNPYNIALHCEARRLAIGVDVFLSPRLPADKTERAKVISEARKIAITRLTSAGLM